MQLYKFDFLQFIFQVWDSDIIESAMKTFYDKDLDVMISAIENNITVWFHLYFF